MSKNKGKAQIKKVKDADAKALSGGILTPSSGFGYTGPNPKPANTNGPPLRTVSYTRPSTGSSGGSSSSGGNRSRGGLGKTE